MDIGQCFGMPPRRSMPIVLVVLLLSFVGCETVPPPRDIHRDALTVVQVRPVTSSTPPYSHPATLSTDQIARILSGLRVQKRGDPILSLVTGEAEETPAFSSTEIQALAPRLGEALAQASPRELVTFYRRYSDSTVGLAITSGGLYVRGSELYVILANARNRPAEVLGHQQAMMYDIDPLDDPLFSLRPASFNLTFTPAAAVRSDHPERRGYIDPSKMIVLDLAQLTVSPPRPAEPPSR
ncbi:hypothetical protein [Candidatus Nitrospira bockiana]